MIRTVALALSIVVAAGGPASAAVARRGENVMGTILEVVVVARDGATAAQLADQAVSLARHWDDVLTTWRPEGELARLNARAGRGAVPVSPDLLDALRSMRRLSAATGGAFDPAVGPLVDLWRAPSAQTPPRPSLRHEITQALTVGHSSAALAAGARLDAGGIGKGIALDAIAGLLRAGGAHSAFLDFGGSSQLAIGAPPDAPAGWPVAVAGLKTGSIHGVVHLRNAALSTSRAIPPGDAAGSIIDPRRGVPVTAPRLATVLAPDATTAEAWSTALIVLGREGIGKGQGIEVFYEDDAGTTPTPGFDLQPGNPLLPRSTAGR